jgi:hypothetical protein
MDCWYRQAREWRVITSVLGSPVARKLAVSDAAPFSCVRTGSAGADT